jgi:hypothetical protein
MTLKMRSKVKFDIWFLLSRYNFGVVCISILPPKTNIYGRNQHCDSFLPCMPNLKFNISQTVKYFSKKLLSDLDPSSVYQTNAKNVHCFRWFSPNRIPIAMNKFKFPAFSYSLIFNLVYHLCATLCHMVKVKIICMYL